MFNHFSPSLDRTCLQSLLLVMALTKTCSLETCSNHGIFIIRRTPHLKGVQPYFTLVETVQVSRLHFTHRIWLKIFSALTFTLLQVISLCLQWKSHKSFRLSLFRFFLRYPDNKTSSTFSPPSVMLVIVLLFLGHINFFFSLIILV